MRMCVQPVAGGRQPTNRGKIMGRSSFVHVGGSMLSAFTFREFRVINRRAGGRCTYMFAYVRVCIYTRVCMCFGSTAPRSCSEPFSFAPMKRNRESETGGYPNIRHPRDLCTPLFGAAARAVLQDCKTEFQSAHESDHHLRPKGPSPPAAAVFNYQRHGDSYGSCGTSARLPTPFSPCPYTPLRVSLMRSLDPPLKLRDNYVASLSDRSLFTRSGIFT